MKNIVSIQNQKYRHLKVKHEICMFVVIKTATGKNKKTERFCNIL